MPGTERPGADAPLSKNLEDGGGIGPDVTNMSPGVSGDHHDEPPRCSLPLRAGQAPSTSWRKDIVRKILTIACALAAVAVLAVANPAQADHGTEGTITVAGVETCSTIEDPAGDSKCTWTATDPNGWVGKGPFTITWVTGDPTDEIGDGSFTCAAGFDCSTLEAETDPIPAGATVTSDGHGPGGGTFAAGDADQHDNS
jgi:hypothetical protein